MKKKHKNMKTLMEATNFLFHKSAIIMCTHFFTWQRKIYHLPKKKKSKKIEKEWKRTKNERGNDDEANEQKKTFKFNLVAERLQNASSFLYCTNSIRDYIFMYVVFVGVISYCPSLCSWKKIMKSTFNQIKSWGK